MDYAHDSEVWRSPDQLERAFAAVPAHEVPPAIDTVSSSVNIAYDADDLEIPAFLRKRGEA